jgi:glyoxylase-like metal-dependent hydrolase (beta-lactamase superfamily II)/rhodanese-related sulfurtransferase
MLKVEVIATDELGDRSYVVHDGQVALAVDPQRDIDRVQALLAEKDLRLELVLETHRHNDYVTGGFALAGETGARYAVPGGEDIDVGDQRLGDGDVLTVGDLMITAYATPGHTHGHLAYAVREADGSEPGALFSGGSLLYGSVGRTDLVGPDDIEGLTRDQFRSVHRLASVLPDDTPVFPTHGFGSFCSSGSATGGDASTIGAEKVRNDALTIRDEDEFVEKLIAGLTGYPAYYAHMGARNKSGPGVPDLSPVTPVDADEVRKRIAGGEWIVDLRERRTFAAGHLGGSISIALGSQFATYLGWLIPWDTAVTLLADTPDQIADAQRQLVRIGIERPAGSSTEPITALAGDDQPRSYPIAAFADVAARRQPSHGHDDGRPWVVLDVRRDDERVHGGIPGSVHIPLDQLTDRLAELPEAALWVHCASGFRASIAASLLDRAGREVVYIDDDYSTAQELGLAPH